MNPLSLLRELSLLEGAKTVLDVGTKDMTIAARFVEWGMQVDAIDIKEPIAPVAGVYFEKIGIVDFLDKNAKRYDIVICRHVLHLLKEPKEIITELHAIAGIFYFTCFGPKDDWAGKVNTLTQDEVLAMFSPETVRHHSEAFQYGKRMLVMKNFGTSIPL